jgi:hypothetical protein
VIPTPTAEQVAQHTLGLISDDAFRGVTATVQRANPEMDADLAARVVTEALKFVATATRTSQHGMRPSKAVDEGWHALILHTRVYEELCKGLGRFVHHAPDAPGSAVERTDALDRTQEAMAEAGYDPDLTLWLRPSGTAECEGGPQQCCEYCNPDKKK